MPSALEAKQLLLPGPRRAWIIDHFDVNAFTARMQDRSATKDLSEVTDQIVDEQLTEVVSL
jgi:hypothetical protein